VKATHQEILWNVTGQTLVWDAPEGRASSVSDVRVYRAEADDDSTVEWTATAAVETNPNTTLDGSAGTGQSDLRVIPLTVTTGIVAERRYLITSVAFGHKEWVEVETVESGVDVTVKHPLVNAYASVDTFVSTRITATVNATWVVDKNEISPEASTFPYYRAVWTYVVSGVTYRHQSYLDLVRLAAYHTVSPLDVDSVQPGWIDKLPVDYRKEQGRPLIEQAFSAVRLDLLADEKATRWLRHLDVMNELVARKAVVLSEELNSTNFGVGVNTTLAQAQERYQQRYDQLIREPKVPIMTSPGGSAFAGDRAPIWRR